MLSASGSRSLGEPEAGRLVVRGKEPAEATRGDLAWGRPERHLAHGAGVERVGDVALEPEALAAGAKLGAQQRHVRRRRYP